MAGLEVPLTPEEEAAIHDLQTMMRMELRNWEMAGLNPNALSGNTFQLGCKLDALVGLLVAKGIMTYPEYVIADLKNTVEQLSEFRTNNAAGIKSREARQQIILPGGPRFNGHRPQG